MSLILLSPDLKGKKILFLGYTQKETSLIDYLINSKNEIWFNDDPIEFLNGYDLIISYGYRHIISGQAIASANCPIINLHISYLPWNRGAHPNFWSFYDETPSGVSIHRIDAGIDTGPTLFQKKLHFNKKKYTFSDSYKILRIEIENLFKLNFEKILSGNYSLKYQKESGTFHKKSDLPCEFRGWNENIYEEIDRLHNIKNRGCDD
jgi:methionyl-tRNA formyltransferase